MFPATNSLGQERASAWQMESGLEPFHSANVCVSIIKNYSILIPVPERFHSIYNMEYYRIIYTLIQKSPLVLCKSWLGKTKQNAAYLVLYGWILEKYSLKVCTKGRDQGCYLQLEVRCLSTQIPPPCV